MELLPQGGASLSGPRYEPPFHGLRELRVAGAAHHVHLDLNRLTRAWYVMAPSVCYGFRPSFEIRFTAAGAKPLANFGLGLAVGRPYAGSRLRTDTVERYLRRAIDHVTRFPEVVSLLCDRPDPPRGDPSDWQTIEGMLGRTGTTGGNELLQPIRIASTPEWINASQQA